MFATFSVTKSPSRVVIDCILPGDPRLRLCRTCREQWSWHHTLLKLPGERSDIPRIGRKAGHLLEPTQRLESICRQNDGRVILMEFRIADTFTDKRADE
jgi:hypothetical protein